MKGKERIGGMMKRFNQKKEHYILWKLINEAPIHIADAQGYTYIPLLNKKRLMKLKTNIRKEEYMNKIRYLQVLIMETF